MDRKCVFCHEPVMGGRARLVLFGSIDGGDFKAEYPEGLAHNGDQSCGSGKIKDNAKKLLGNPDFLAELLRDEDCVKVFAEAIQSEPNLLDIVEEKLKEEIRPEVEKEIRQEFEKELKDKGLAGLEFPLTFPLV